MLIMKGFETCLFGGYVSKQRDADVVATNNAMVICSHRFDMTPPFSQTTVVSLSSERLR